MVRTEEEASKRGRQAMTFREMLNHLTLGGAFTRKKVAASLGISPQYLHDLLKGRRTPSVRVVNAICNYMGRGPKGRLEWHIAAARAHGWEV